MNKAKVRKFTRVSIWVTIILLALPLLLTAGIKSTTGEIGFDVNGNGNVAVINSTGLGIGNSSPAANLHVQGNTIVSNSLSIGQNTSPQSTVDVAGSIGFGVQTVSDNTLLDAYSLVLADSSSGNILITLPKASEVEGRIYKIKKINTSNEVKITGTVIDNFQGLTLSTNSLSYVSLVAQGNNWYITSQKSDVQSLSGGANIIGWWPFDETSGTTATDIIGSEKHGTLNGSFTFASSGSSAVVGRGLSFDGVDDYVSMGDIDALEASDVSFSLWLKLDSISVDQEIIAKGDHTTNEAFFMWYDPVSGGTPDAGGTNTNTLTLYTYDGSVDIWISASSNILDNFVWNHIVAVIDKSNDTVSLYVNGVHEVSHSEPFNGILAGTKAFIVGTDSPASTNYLSGMVDDLRIYDYALSAAEVSALYTFSNEATDASGIPRCWLTLDESSGNTASDSSGYGNDGILLGSGNFDTQSVSGNINTAYNFNGTDDSITLGDLNWMEFSNLSISFWVKLTDTAADYELITKGNHAANQPLVVFFDKVVASADVGASNTNTVQMLVYDGSVAHSIAASDGSLNNTNWNHIVCTIDRTNNTLKIYINGSLDVSNTKSFNGVNTGSEVVYLGRSMDALNFLKGSLDDVRFYTSVLTLAEVQALFNQ